MTIKITTPNGGSDSLDFGCAQTPVVATVTGTEVSSGEGKLELKTTTGGTSATKATILANGRVGIGTATADEALQVNGAIKVTAGMATDTASTGAMGYQNSKYRFISWGADTSTKGAYGFEGYSSNGSVNATHLAIDATGKVGIGTTAPVQKLELNENTTSGGPYLQFENRGTDTTDNSNTYNVGGILAAAYRDAANPANIGSIMIERGIEASGASSSGSIVFGTMSTPTTGIPTERMRITSDGTVLMGQTTNPATATLVLKVPTGSANGVNAQITSNTGTSYPWSNYNASGTYVGGITCTSSATAFPTSSDVRLKKNIKDAPSAIEKIKAARVISHEWKEEDTAPVEFGFVAQELIKVVPQAVIEGKDKEDGGIEIPWGVDYSKLVPLLVKTIQELEARIAKLEEDK
jgi:hypothetical protein